MPDPRRASCNLCGRHKSVCGPISWTGKCQTCAEALLTLNMVGLADHSGKPFKEWRRGVAASVGAILLDDTPEGT